MKKVPMLKIQITEEGAELCVSWVNGYATVLFRGPGEEFAVIDAIKGERPKSMDKLEEWINENNA
jgi:hypothetical protein